MDGIIIPPQGVANLGNSDPRQQQQFIQQIQQQILSLPNNTTIFSTVVGVDRNSNPVIRVAGLDLVLSSTEHLAKGSQLAIRVDHGSGSVHLELISVDGKLPATQPQAVSSQFPNLAQLQLPVVVKILQAFPQNTVALSGEPQQAINIVRPETVVFSNQQHPTLTGVVINVTPEIIKSVKASFNEIEKTKTLPPEIKNLPEQIKQGTEIKFKLLNISLPEDLPENFPDQKISPENKIENKILTQEEVQNFKPQIQITEDGEIKITALVLGKNNNDELLVQTKFGRVVLDNPLKGEEAKLPPGSVISLQIEELVEPLQISYPQNNEKAVLKTLSHDFPALAQLTQTDAGKAVLNKVAGTHGLVAANIIKFINAVKNNKFEDWLSGDAIKDMDAGTREKLVQQLRADFQNLQKVMNEQGQSWQTIFFPIFDGEELHQLQLHVKKFQEDQEKLGKYKGTRFLVELEAGTFGEMQFDGLVRKSTISSNFDLVVRTHRNLDSEVKRDITEIFGNAAQITGFKGGIDFAVMREFPTRVLEEKLAKACPQNKIDV